MKDAKTNAKKVLLADDHTIVRHGIAQLINQADDLIVCAEAQDVSGAMNAIAKSKPDVVVTDITLTSSNGLELIKNVHALYPKLPILVVTMHDEALYGELALRAGALGYITKQEALDKIITGIRRVLSGAFFVSEAMAAKIFRQQLRGEGPDEASPAQRLSARELEVFQLIGQWRGTSQIAKELNLSVKTIEYYREQIKQKLGLKNATELTQSAIEWVQQGKAN